MVFNCEIIGPPLEPTFNPILNPSHRERKLSGFVYLSGFLLRKQTTSNVVTRISLSVYLNLLTFRVALRLGEESGRVELDLLRRVSVSRCSTHQLNLDPFLKRPGSS